MAGQGGFWHLSQTRRSSKRIRGGMSHGKTVALAARCEGLRRIGFTSTYNGRARCGLRTLKPRARGLTPANPRVNCVGRRVTSGAWRWLLFVGQAPEEMRRSRFNNPKERLVVERACCGLRVQTGSCALFACCKPRAKLLGNLTSERVENDRRRGLGCDLTVPIRHDIARAGGHLRERRVAECDHKRVAPSQKPMRTHVELHGVKCILVPVVPRLKNLAQPIGSVARRFVCAQHRRQRPIGCNCQLVAACQDTRRGIDDHGLCFWRE
jgi:hypothetical protein